MTNNVTFITGFSSLPAIILIKIEQSLHIKFLVKLKKIVTESSNLLRVLCEQGGKGNYSTVKKLFRVMFSRAGRFVNSGEEVQNENYSLFAGDNTQKH
jgi:hypothetical protein